MEQYKEEFIEFMVDCQVLKFGAFVTKSGRNTPFFVNTGFYRTGEQLRPAGRLLCESDRIQIRHRLRRTVRTGLQGNPADRSDVHGAQRTVRSRYPLLLEPQGSQGSRR